MFLQGHLFFILSPFLSSQPLGQVAKEELKFRWRKHNVHSELLSWFNSSAVTEVQTITSWSAPIMWEGTFDPVERDEFYFKRKAVIGLTVFAIGRYLDRYLKDFLESAEQHFMKGHRVIYYVMVDVASKVPALKMPSEWTMIVIQVPKQSRWQDISMMRMYQINDFIQDRVQFQVTHLFCFDVDQVFVVRFGVEALADSVIQILKNIKTGSCGRKIHRGDEVSDSPGDNGLMFSGGVMVQGEVGGSVCENKGDFYYHAAVFGGRPDLVLNLTRTCLEGIIRNKSKKIEAVWHDESHLNRYFLDHKPAKLLSPEYCWDLKPAKHIRYVRLKWMPKEYKKLRENWTRDESPEPFILLDFHRYAGTISY
ncbi:N-acetyllactosaminide alpha-1,3-galactosyltransferase-like [Carcharodon carcharias]|uniref:N-acetyllactosaminide alpha-1,3-galactosyltransferase-like n=1 Tax=Carcharodon carcharias TaxID=13397 RepID=UPI001B7DB5C7|nr:N-acetyllactosaminide alpha-1,3-galactosyltransferase-like [Carcharodon carcharias]